MCLLMTVSKVGCVLGPVLCTLFWDLLYSSAVLYHLFDAELLPLNAEADVERIRGTACQLCLLSSAQNFNPSVSQDSSANLIFPKITYFSCELHK